MDKGILIIEDETIIALDIARKIRHYGYSVSGIAADESEALSLAAKDPPALALVDIKLKNASDGIEAARKLTEQFSIPIVFITAYSDNRVRERAMQLQPEGFLLKPINRAEFETTIKSVMTR